MALFTPSESPAVVVKEVDLTGGVPNVQSTTGAIVGNFRWGPVEERRKIANEAELVDVFAAPDSDNTIDFHSAAYFLRYSNSMQTVRAVTSAAKNAVANGTAPTIKNASDFESRTGALDSDDHRFAGKYPGDLGNSIRVSVCHAHSADSAFDSWTYKSSFDGAPGTSSYATRKNASNDEVHIAVVDVNGEFTGTAGTVLETYPYLSLGTDAKNDDGTTNYAKKVVNERSEYVWLTNFDSDFNAAGAGSTIDSGDDFAITSSSATNYDLSGGINSGSLTTTEFAAGHDLFEDKDTVEVDFLISPSLPTRTNHDTVVTDLTASAIARKDCIVVASPCRNDVVGQTSGATITTNIKTTADGMTYSSYLVMDGNFLKVYDKYNDQYIEIPAASSTAGLMAATDRNAAPWFSPAGSRRGQYLGVTSVSYSPTKGQRDTLYKAGVNPIANIPGQGLLLFGDKTHMNRPSAFDRINVRRLFLVLERAIARAAENVLFEFNDEFTRAEFVNIIEPVLREVKGRRGITDFRVVADETNNTAAVIDRNEFVANIFIKPARSINYVTLNFVAVRTGVDFEEVVGTV
jgi:hypothetical protein